MKAAMDVPPGLRREQDARFWRQEECRHPLSGRTPPLASNHGLGRGGYLPQNSSLARGRLCVRSSGPEVGTLGTGQRGGKVSLTCTHSYCVPRAVPTVIAVEAPVGVTDGGLRAVVPKLLCTHLTAFTAICDEADPQWAAGWGRRTLTWPLAELGA